MEIIHFTNLFKKLVLIYFKQIIELLLQVCLVKYSFLFDLKCGKESLSNISMMLYLADSLNILIDTRILMMKYVPSCSV